MRSVRQHVTPSGTESDDAMSNRSFAGSRAFRVLATAGGAVAILGKILEMWRSRALGEHPDLGSRFTSLALYMLGLLLICSAFSYSALMAWRSGVVVTGSGPIERGSRPVAFWLHVSLGAVAIVVWILVLVAVLSVVRNRVV